MVPGDGGAIFNICHMKKKDCLSNYTGNVFDGNFADHNGGGVAWLENEPLNLAHGNVF